MPVERHAAAFTPDIGAGRHSDPDIGLRKGWGVVDTIACMATARAFDCNCLTIFDW